MYDVSKSEKEKNEDKGEVDMNGRRRKKKSEQDENDENGGREGILFFLGFSERENKV
jgi:hypothetical protein